MDRAAASISSERAPRVHIVIMGCGRVGSSLARQLGRAGRRRVLDSFTWRAAAERTADWYAETLERKGRPC